MAEDWAIDVRKYVPNADSKVIDAIVRYCGIALHNRDSSLVSFTEPEELRRIRENYLRKKLGLAHSDAELDDAIIGVGERMSADRTKNRVTVYYLLAEHFRKLSVFGGTDVAGGIGKASMIHNSATPRIDIDPETYEVRADGQLLVCEPAKVLPMAQRYFLF